MSDYNQLLPSNYFNFTGNFDLMHLIYDVFEEMASGFGLRNYWARTYYDVIIEIRDQKYKYWKREYGMK